MTGYCLTQARVLTPQGWSNAPLAFGTHIGEGDQTLDASGLWALPGIIDLHGDGFERHVAPRRGMLRDFSQALSAVEGELASSGITTAYLAQFVSWEGGMRGPEFARDFAQGMAEYPALLDMRMQLRLETHFFEGFETALEIIETHGLDFLVLNDHLPHKALAAGKRPPGLVGQALKAKQSPEAHLAMLEKLHAAAPLVSDKLKDLIEQLPGGVVVGSHDDPDAATRHKMAKLGARLSEFPESFDALEAAKEQNAPIVLGAPNLVRGKSHKGNLAVADVIRAGYEVALVSDYHYPSLCAAVVLLADQGMAFEKAWRFVSEIPARAMGWTDRGHLADGARADVVLFDPRSQQIVATFAAGKPAYVAPPLLARWLAA
ncbi:MAG: alpha-D-ribose 1-methylphosphonate 5-triphosphate diphosphatase [Pseudomonadota bacterium]